jgi:hypothetical protein
MRSFEEYCKLAHKVHNNKFHYLHLITENRFRKIYFNCPTHGLCNQFADSHLQGKNCKQCSVDIRKEKRRFSFDHYVANAKIIFGNMYEYIELIPKNKREKQLRKIRYICGIHGEVVQTADNHLKGWGCNQCGYKKVSDKLSDSFETVIKKSKLVHGDYYTYIRLYKENGKRLLEINCPKHGVFTQIASDHLTNGSGCYKCSNTNSSRVENIWLDSLNIDKKYRQIRLPSIGKIKVDGYDPTSNTVYEFYGDFWHGNPKVYDSNKINPRNGKTFGYLYNQTIIRENRIKQHYNLQTIWENEWLKLSGETINETIRCKQIS